MKVTIHLPDDIAHYEPELRYFIDTMIQKLYINRHKGFCENRTVGQMMGLMRDEIIEAESAYSALSQFEFMLECVDVANMAWLAALVALRQTRAEWDKRPKTGYLVVS